MNILQDRLLDSHFSSTWIHRLEMWPLWVALRTYGPYITFPIAAVVGAIGIEVSHAVSITSIIKEKSVKKRTYAICKIHIKEFLYGICKTGRKLKF